MHNCCEVSPSFFEVSNKRTAAAVECSSKVVQALSGDIARFAALHTEGSCYSSRFFFSFVFQQQPDSVQSGTGSTKGTSFYIASDGAL